MKKITLIFGIIFLITWSCEEDNGFTSEGPISGYLKGKWKLIKIVSPKTTKVDTQIGYSEVIEIGNNGKADFENVYKDDQLSDNYIWSRSRNADMSSKNMTVLMRYSGNKERFYKIVFSSIPALEASAYLEKVGNTQDTVKYYYSLIR